MAGNSSWMPCAPQGVKGFDDDDDDLNSEPLNFPFHQLRCLF